MKHKAHVAPAKKELVKKISKVLEQHPIIGVADMENLSSSALQNMRKQLRGKAEILMAKSNLIKLAIQKSKEKIQGLEKLNPLIEKGMPSLLLTKENPFTLYKIIKKNKTQAAAKPGQIAPTDIIIPKGPTPFTPGPVISELAQLGIKSGVEAGKIVVKEEKTVVEEGKEISPLLSSMLVRLGIKPMEIGLNLTGVLEKGIMYDKKVLDIDEKAFLEKLSKAFNNAQNLSVETAYLTNKTKELLIQKAFKNAKNLAVTQGILAKGIIKEIITKAYNQMKTLNELIK